MVALRIQLKLALTLLVCQALLCGCAHQYLMTLTNGDQLLSYSKPKRQEANYLFTDGTGTKHRIPENRVAKIRSVSVVKDEPKPMTPSKSRQPKHWYYLWLN